MFMNSDTLNKIKRSLDTGEVTSITCSSFKITKSGNDFQIETLEGQYIFRLDSLSMLTVEITNIIEEVSSKYDYHSDIGDWSVDSDSEYPQWKTPVTEQTVSIKPINNFSMWRVKYPEEMDTIAGLYYDTHDVFQTALINVLYYLQTTNAYRIDYMHRLEEIAIEAFQTLPGITESTANNIVTVYEIYQYQDLLEEFEEVTSLIPEDKQQDCKNALEQKVSSGDETIKSDDLSKITQKVTLDNI